MRRCRSGREELKELALRLYDLGFNVVPVRDKKPLVKWSPRERISREELEEKLEGATGISVVGGPENPWKPVATLVIVDIDDPSALEKHPLLRSIIESTVRWRTGPRCPSCGGKQVELREDGWLKCSKCGAEFTPERAGRGLAALITIDPEAAEKYLRSTRRGRDVELLINNYALIPPSKHPSGLRYEWDRPFDFDAPNLGIRALLESELLSLLEELGAVRRDQGERGVEEPAPLQKAPRPEPRVLRELSDSDVLKIKELLREGYSPGARQYMWLFLSGWAAKAGVSPVSVARVLKMLYEEAGDTDPIRARASALVYSYKKAGVDLAPYADRLREVLGCDPYGLERELREEELKGKSGLQEILEEALGEERALDVIRELEEVLGSASPFRDSVVEILDYEKKLYAVANLRRLVVVRARRDGNRLVYKERVTVGAPTEVAVYFNPIGGVTKYEVRWESPTRRAIRVGPATVEEIIDRLRLEGLVLNSRLAGDVVSAVIEGFIRRGRATVREELEAPGFYLVDGRVVPVRVEVKPPTKDELREALELLRELAEQWFKHALDKFVTVVKWGLIAPFAYVFKQRGRWVRWLYLYGSSRTGKTTLGRIVLSLWGLGAAHEKSGGHVDTPARLGAVLSSGTLPVLVNEPGGALSKEEIVELVKAAVESAVVRGKYVRGAYTEIPALAPVVFTSNRYLPRDDALLRRLIVLSFSYGERIPEDRAREFEERVRPRLGKLKALGDYVASAVVSEPQLLEKAWEQLAEELLERAYAEAGLQPPSWIRSRVGEERDVYDEVRELVRGFLLSRVNEAFTKHTRKVVAELHRLEGEEEVDRQVVEWATEQVPLKDKVLIVIDNQWVPWLLRRGDEVVVTAGVTRELREELGLDLTVKDLAEIMGWRYEPRKSVRLGNRVTSFTCSVAPLAEMLETLTPVLEDQQAQQQAQGQQTQQQQEGEVASLKIQGSEQGQGSEQAGQG